MNNHEHRVQPGTFVGLSSKACKILEYIIEQDVKSRNAGEGAFDCEIDDLLVVFSYSEDEIRAAWQELIDKGKILKSA